MSKQLLIMRHTASERINHWMMAICFLLTAFSGLSFFHPGLFWLGHLYGSPTWARILHPFLGVTAFFLFILWIFRLRKDNRILAVDWEWARHMQEIIQNKTDHLPELGKYNMGQKLLTRLLALTLLLLLISGLLIWQPWLAPYFSIPLRRIAVGVHACAAFVVLLCVLGHLYAAIWTSGSIHSMVYGTVSAAWARHHHAAWYKEKMKKQTETKEQEQTQPAIQAAQ